MNTANDTLKKYDNNKCDKCNIKIHPNFIGYHKCGYANCAICKNAITNSEYWYHIRSHPGHENDSPPPPLQRTFGNRDRQQYSGKSGYGVGGKGNIGGGSLATGSTGVIQQLKVGEEYEVDTTEISTKGDGIARRQGFIIFVKGGHIGEKVKIIISKITRRFAIARTA
ncbi:MAG: TRAM domain-containing protein [Nitrososphaeraceae archaeon]